MNLVDVTVLFPCFNEASLLPLKLSELTNCRFAPKEIVICDDGSSDDSVNVIQSFPAHNITLLRHRTNLGIHAALTTLLSFEIATSWFVLTTPSDSLHPQYFEAFDLMHTLYPQIDFFFTDYSEASSSIAIRQYTEDFILRHAIDIGYQSSTHSSKFLFASGLKFPASLSFAYHSSHKNRAKEILGLRRLNAYIDICLLAELFSGANSSVYLRCPLAIRQDSGASQGQFLSATSSSLYPLGFFIVNLISGRLSLIPFLVLLRYVLRRRLTKFHSLFK